MPTRKLLLAIFLFLILACPVKSQGPIYLPVMLSGENMIKPLKSTIAITIPYGNQNYVLNPSGEIDGNFANEAGGAVTRSTLFQRYGLYSYEVVTANDGDGINLDLLTLDNVPYYVTFRVHSTNGSQDNVSLNVILGAKTAEAKLLEKLDRGNGVQWDLYGASFSASEASGQTNLLITQRGATASSVYIDGVQVAPSNSLGQYDTYIDGTQLDCRWLGAPHASASMRSGDSRAGGVVTSFWEGFNFFPEKALGLGTAIEELNIDSYAFLPGGELNSSKIPPREFTIIGYFLADTVEELHEHAQRLELELGLNTYPSRQPVRLRYSGARVLKEISANYTGGLEGDLPIFYNDDWSQEDEAWVRNYKFKMRASISWVALDPFWYEVGESTTLLDTNDSDTFRVVAARLESSGQWDALAPPNAAGTYTAVRAIAEDDIYIYFGGDFLNFDNIANADYIVRRNKQTGIYSAMGTGITGGVTVPGVWAIAIAPNGYLVVVGDFTSAGGVANTANIAVWNGTSWVSIATGGANGIVYALAFSPDGLLYVAGDFTTIGGVAANRVAVYNGTSWSALSTGLGATAYALAIDNQTELVYIGHSDTGFISVWDGSSLSVVGGGMDDDVRALAITLNGLLYAGGLFTTAGSVSASRIAAWNGSVWQALGDGVSRTGIGAIAVLSLAIGPDGVLYLGGIFNIAGDITLADNVAKWNGYTYSHLSVDLPGTTNVFAIHVSQFDVDPLVLQNYTFYLGFNTSGTAFYSGLVSSQNEGTISAFPKIVFSRSGGTGAIIQTLRNERIGRELLFDYSLLDGESLTIDLNPKNRTITSSFFGPRMSAVLANSDLSIWQLLPGDNDITSFVSEDGSPTIVGYLLWREPYRGWN